MLNELNKIFPKYISNKFDVIQLAGDASTRKYYRIIANNKSYVLMSMSSFENDTPFISTQKYIHSLGVNVPSILDFNDKLGYILLEDLGDITMESAIKEDINITKELYFKAIDSLIMIQVAEESVPSTIPAKNLYFDNEKFSFELNFMVEHLFKGFLKLNLDDKDISIINDFNSSLIKRITEAPMYFCHRDYHSRNLMYKNEQLYQIDFQDARLGIKYYDLSSLLFDAYIVLTDDFRNELLKYYENKTNEKIDEKYFYLTALQRNLKASGSFASFYNTRGISFYLHFLISTFSYIISHLKRFPEYIDFTNLLTKHKIIDRIAKRVSESSIQKMNK